MSTSDKESEIQVDYQDLLMKSLQQWKTDYLEEKLKNTESTSPKDKKKLKNEHFNPEKFQELIKSADFQASMKRAAQWISASVFGAFCFVYAMVFKQYKQAVEKHQSLTDIIKNPNVRVAHGEKAKQVL